MYRMFGGESAGSQDEDEEVLPPEGTVRFRLPIPGKADGIVLLPDDIDNDDWEMLKIQLNAFVNRLVKNGE